MKNNMNIVAIMILFICAQSCTTNEKNTNEEQVFSPVLEKEIIAFMSLYESKGSVKNVFSIQGDSIGNDKYILLTVREFYEKRRTSSYTFIGDHLIILEKPYDKFPFEGWINSDALIQFEDSIPNYKELFASIPADSEPLTRQLRIISKDSLEIVDTQILLNRTFFEKKKEYLIKLGKEEELEEMYNKSLLFTIPHVKPHIEKKQ